MADGLNEDDYDSEEENEEELKNLLLLLRKEKRENTELKKNFESLRALYLSLQNAQAQLQSKHNSLYEERVNVERQYQQLCESWRIELEDKQKQFELARAQILGPRDLELLRVRLLEEVEGPYKLKCELLAREAEVAQQSFVRTRRDYEELLNSCRSMEMRAQNELTLLKSEHALVAQELKDRLAIAEQPKGKAAALSQRVRTVERERDEAQFTINALRAEVEELRLSRESSTREKNKAAMTIEKKMKQIQAEEMELASLVETLTRKNRHLSSELGASQQAQEALYQSLLKANAREAAAATAAEAAAVAATAAAKEEEERWRNVERSLEEKLEAAQQEALTKDRQLSEAIVAHKSELQALKEQLEARLAGQEAEATEKLRQVKSDSTVHAVKIEALERALKGAEREAELAREEWKANRIALEGQIKSLREELDAARQSAKTAADQAESAGEAAAAARAESERINRELDDALRDVAQLRGVLAAADKTTKTLESARKKAVEGAERLKAALEQERADATMHAAESRQAWMLEKSGLAKRHDALVKELQAKHEVAMRHMKKRLKEAHRALRELTAGWAAEPTGPQYAADVSSPTQQLPHTTSSTLLKNLQPRLMNLGIVKPGVVTQT